MTLLLSLLTTAAAQPVALSAVGDVLAVEAHETGCTVVVEADVADESLALLDTAELRWRTPCAEAPAVGSEVLVVLPLAGSTGRIAVRHDDGIAEVHTPLRVEVAPAWRPLSGALSVDDLGAAWLLDALHGIASDARER